MVDFGSKVVNYGVAGNLAAGKGGFLVKKEIRV